MSRSLSNVKLLAASFADVISPSIYRRGYAAAAATHGTVSGAGGSRGGMVGKIKEMKEGSADWAPHPITGYYRPANCTDEIDPADLRQMLLSNKVKPHH